MFTRFYQLLSQINRQQYWNTIAGKFSREEWQNRIFPQHIWLAEIVNQSKPKTILEVGCGFGRNLNYLITTLTGSPLLIGSDFSLNMLKLSQNKLQGKIPLINANILSLPFSDSSCSLVFTHGVLMHTKPKEVETALDELIRVASNKIVIIEEVRTRPQQINTHTWAHDYLKLLSAKPVKINQINHDQSDLIWIEIIKKLPSKNP
jgi:ubiquinone/menaquinone biosynthesis C-methylase UbiE